MRHIIVSQERFKMDRKFNIIKIDHIAIASEETSKLTSFFENLLGSTDKENEIVESEGVSVFKYKVGEVAIETLEIIGSNPSLKKFIDKKGTAFHHMSFLVDNILEAIQYFKGKNIKVIYDPPKIGASNKYITFLHPSDSCGLLIEISQNIDG